MWAGSVLCRIALWDYFGDAIAFFNYCFFYWLLGGCAGNWVEINPPKRSHNAFRHDTDPVSTTKRTKERQTWLQKVSGGF